MPKSKTIRIISGGKTKAPSKAIFTLEKIRQAGICSHYENLKSQGLSAQDCLVKTRDFARTSISQVKGILTGNIQKPGKRLPKGQDIDYLKKNDEIMGSSRPDIGKLQELKTAVMEDTTLYDQLKNAFVEMIDRNISSARNAASKADQDSDRPQASERNLMKRIIEIFESYENQSEDHRNAAEEIRAYFFGDDDK